MNFSKKKRLPPDRTGGCDGARMSRTRDGTRGYVNTRGIFISPSLFEPSKTWLPTEVHNEPVETKRWHT